MSDRPTVVQSNSIDTPEPARIRLAPWLIALLGWTALLCFYDLGGGGRFEPIDCWVAQTAREMKEAGDWLVPRFSGEVRMQKSPGPYWAVMLVAQLRGAPVDEIAARIPNAIAAVGLVLTIFWLTLRIAGPREAIFAGFAASSSVLVLWWSHRGASDLGLTTLTALSLASLWIAVGHEPPGRRRNALLVLGYFAAGLGMLYKMPMPLAVVGAPAFFYVLLRNRWKIFINRWHLVGIVAFLLPWVPWAVAVMFAEDAALAKWKVEFLDRFTGDLPNVEGQGGWKNIAFYLPVPLQYCLPFTLSLPMAFWRAVRPQPGVNRDGQWFLLIWFFSLLVFFTASTGKEYRYFLPALPPLFVMLGIELSAFFHPRRVSRGPLEWVAAIAVWVGAPAALIVGGWFGLRKWWDVRGSLELEMLHGFGEVWSAYLVTVAILCIGFGVAAWLYIRRHEHASFGALVGTMWLMWLWAWPSVVPYFMSQRPFVDFSQQLVKRVPAEFRPDIRMVGSQDPRITWFSNVRFPRVIDQLVLLEEQKARYARGEQESLRDLEYEMRRYGEEIVNLLEGDEPALFVVPFEGMMQFLLQAPRELAQQGREMPPVYLWLQTRYGNFDRHFILFGNQPPPFRAPHLELPAKLARKLEERGETLPVIPQPAPPGTQPTIED